MAEAEKLMDPKASLWRCNSQFMPISKGMVECPKCFGASELDLTPRDAKGWPTGPCARATCDNCDGEGEVKDEPATPPVAAKAPERIVEPIANVGWGATPATGWPVFKG